MKFTPKTEKEIQEENLWPNGNYTFEIAKANNGVSKNNNDMIVLQLNVFTEDGSRVQIVTDYLVEAVLYKLRHCADACGLLDKYEQGELNAEDFVGKSGTIKLGIQKDKTGEYDDKNVVKDYIVENKLTAAQEKHTQDKGNAFVSADLDDGIPF